MLGSGLARLAKQSALRVLLLRASLVGVNFLVMLGLAALLGFETFGALVSFWALALVAGAVVSIGGPLILLKNLTDGRGMPGFDVCKVALIYPAAIALAACLIGTALWPTMPWMAILGAGFCANMLGCVASMMRALGSVQLSMALRDAGPQVALGLAGLTNHGVQADAILLTSAIVMAAMAVGGALWANCHANLGRVLSTPRRPFFSMSLWANAVLGVVASQVDLIVGGAIISAEQLGVYAVLRRVANLVALPVTVATWVSAPAVSAAYGAQDLAGLAKASAEGSQIALLPGLALFTLGALSLPLVSWQLPDGVAGLVFAILLFGALGQVVFASSFTVATLCDAAAYAMSARLLMIASYLIWVFWMGAELTIVSNTVGYIGASIGSGLVLWWAVKRRLGVDTSAAVLWWKMGGPWRTS